MDDDQRREQIKRDAAELAERTRREQGLPRYVEDPVVLAKIATIMKGGTS